MNPIHLALRRPRSILVIITAVVLVGLSVIRPGSADAWLAEQGVVLPLKRMPVDIFPSLNLPVIYVCQPYGGMDPAQMEGLLTNYYEYHFLYINGIHHVESRNVQGTALMKLQFHPGTNMAQAMAETINYVNRSRAMMPPGTVPPFVMRFDTGSVPVGYLVLSSATKTIAEIQDQALFKVRPLFSSLPGVSAPPPFGGSARSVVIRADPNRLRSAGLSPDDVIAALSAGNTISPSGNLRLGSMYPAVPTNAMVRDIRDLGRIPLKTGERTVYLRDIGTIEDAADLTTGYALVNGRRAVYILATRRADASTMNVIREIKSALPKMQQELPGDIQVAFEFDQSPWVMGAIRSLASEGLIGAVLTGLMVLVFLRDWRSAIVVVVNIPLALLSAVVGLWLTGQTINLMTLGGLALAVGILVDEATVEIENIHSRLQSADSVGAAVLAGNQQTAVPRFLAMLCILAVFVPTFFMEGAPRELFAPLSLAVGFAMVSSWILSGTLVPILCIWLLKLPRADRRSAAAASHQSESLVVLGYRRIVRGLVAARFITVPAWLGLCSLLLWQTLHRVGIEIFPTVDSGEFRLRLRAPEGTHIDETERLAKAALEAIAAEIGPENVRLTLGYVGTVAASFPVNAVYQFSRGPEEAILRIALRPGSGVSTSESKERLRQVLGQQFPSVRFSFEPADIVSEVMSFGSPTPLEIAVRGGNLAENRAFIERLRRDLAQLPALRDVHIQQSLDYPTVEVRIDREKAGFSGVTASQVSRSVLTATSSSRFVVPNYWPDPKTGVGYQVQVEIPQPAMKSLDDLGTVPVLNRSEGSPLLLRDVAQISQGTMPGEFDRYNMKRELSITANLEGADLNAAVAAVLKVLAEVKRADDAEKDERDKAAVAAAVPGQPAPTKAGRITYELRGQIPVFRQMLSGLAVGLLLAVLAILLMLTAGFQSLRLAVCALAAVPAVPAGALLVLLATNSTLNIQSFIGVIMGIGVAMANAILVLSFAETRRREGVPAREAAVDAAAARLRPVLMTSLAMLAGMLPMALGLGEAGQQTAPLGRAVMGGLAAATFATLLVLPAVFALLQGNRPWRSPSLHPLDQIQQVKTSSPAVIITVIAGIFCGTAGCSREAGRTDSDTATAVTNQNVSPAVPKVAASKPVRTTIRQTTQQPGRLEAWRSAPIHAQIGGLVGQLNVDIGDRVSGPEFDSEGRVTKPGQLLAQLTAPDLDEELNEAAALVLQLQAEVGQATSAVTLAATREDSALARVAECRAGCERAAAVLKRWQQESERIQELAEKKTVTEKLAEETELQRRAAEAGRVEADAALRSAEALQREAAVGTEKANADLATAKARQKVAEAERDRVAARNAYLQIRAPFDGIISERHVDIGHVIEPGSGRTLPLFVVVQADRLRLSVDIPETEAVLAEPGCPAKITLASMPAESLTGQISRTAWALQDGTRSLRCEIDLPNTSGQQRPGMYASVEITVGEHSNVLCVPKSALVVRDGKTLCAVITAENRIQFQPVQTGLRSATEVEITAGVDENTLILSANPAGYSDGMQVEVLQP